MIKDKYEDLLRNFELYYPKLYSQAIDWWVSGRMSIMVRLEDGNTYEYDRSDDSIRLLRTGPDRSDESVAKDFGCNLRKFITLSGMTQKDICERLGITNAMLSRYIHGTSMPSAGKAYRLANLLGCTVDELFNGIQVD